MPNLPNTRFMYNYTLTSKDSAFSEGFPRSCSDSLGLRGNAAGCTHSEKAKQVLPNIVVKLVLILSECCILSFEAIWLPINCSRTQGTGTMAQSATCGRGHLNLPHDATKWLDDWGQVVGPTIIKASEETILFPFRGFDIPEPLLVGTDCSGVEAPIHALKGLGAPHRHMFSSEIWEPARLVIQANTMPEHALFRSVLDLDWAPFVHLYISGFSCKPFSLLHHKTHLLDEEEAKIFYSVVKRIGQVRPASFVLENVPGICRVKEQVEATLRKEGYSLVILRMDPTDLGIPVCRPRFYFLGVRRDLARSEEVKMQEAVDSVWAKVKGAFGDRDQFSMVLSDILLPNEHALVVEHERHRAEKWKAAKAAGFPSRKDLDQCKWKELHEAVKEQNGLDVPCHDAQSHSPADTLHLCLPRERDAWNIMCAQKQGSSHVTADLSQNLLRNGVRSDGFLPTITPGSVVPIPGGNRVMIPIEKLLVHGLPLHRMALPAGISQKQWANMGGNTMSVPVVGAAILLSMLLVDWNLLVDEPSDLQEQRPDSTKSYHPFVCHDALSKRYAMPIPSKSKCKASVAKQTKKSKPCKVLKICKHMGAQQRKCLGRHLAQRWHY